MLSKQAFLKGIKNMQAVFNIDPDNETAEIWYRHLANKVDDKYFVAGILLMTGGDDNERLKTIYPNQNMIDIFLSYATKARDKEFTIREKLEREDWEIERYKLLLEEQKKAEKQRREHYRQLPDPRHVKNVKRLFLEDKQ